MELFEVIINEAVLLVTAMQLPEDTCEEPAPQRVGTWLWMACVSCVELSRVDCQHHIHIYIIYIYNLFGFEVTAS